MMEGKGNATRITADCDDDCTAFVVSLGDVGGISSELDAIGESFTDRATDNDIEVSKKFCRFEETFTKKGLNSKTAC